MKARPSFTRSPLAALLPCVVIVSASALAADAVLPGTDPLTIERPLDEVMVEGLNRFCRRELAASRGQRATHWRRDFSGDQAYAASVLPHRERFRALIGAVDPRRTAEASGSSGSNWSRHSTNRRSSREAIG